MSDHSARVAIIGCGFSGIAAGIGLQREGITDFVIFEASDGIGGTWWKNRYPGAEVDLESHLYAFSYAPANWTRTHAGGGELQRYLERVADEHHLREHVVFGERVHSAEWSAGESAYHLQTSSGRDWGAFNAVISAVGYLNVPVLPPFVKEGTFSGVLCHTSQWPDGLDLTGMKVGVAGTGSSAVQVIA
ncbi:MAG: flavin-containing monooxygenase, partial [Sciscionella sp.]